MDLNILRKISYGMYIITSCDGDRINGQFANTAFQTTSEPPTIAISINKLNYTHEIILKGGVFAVTILEKEAPLKLIGQFGFKSGRDGSKFENIKYDLKATKCPIILEHSIGYMEAKLISTLDVGTHTIFVGEIVGAEMFADVEPMTYAYYHEVKRGTTHKNAPTFIKQG